LNTETEPRPGTMGSLDRRVERLESEFADLKSDMKIIKLEQQHSRELADAHFAEMRTANGVTLAKIELLIARFDTAMTAGYAASGDPTSTPAGKMIVERISTIERDKEREHTELDERLDDLESRATGVERRVYMAVGATVLAVLVIQMLAPLLLRLIP
jgi:chaperonin cofactor prefoldin